MGYVEGMIGGSLLGASAVVFLLTTGRLVGISGFVHGIVSMDASSIRWKVAWLSGLVVAASMMRLYFGEEFFGKSGSATVEGKDATLLGYTLSGLMVGWGSRCGSGCTSGHGVMGIARFSPRSIIATMVFMLSALLTATAMQLQGGPAGLYEDVRGSENASDERITMVVGGSGMVGFLYVLVAYGGWDRVRDSVVSFLSGLLFGVGLVVGGMGSRDKIAEFLVLGRTWDVQLMFVMGSGLIIAMLGYWLAAQLGQPLFGPRFGIPTSTVITGRLIFGSVLFGAGWGLTSLCPGPGLLQAGAGMPRVLLGFIPGMAVGMWLWNRTEPLWESIADSWEARTRHIPTHAPVKGDEKDLTMAATAVLQHAINHINPTQPSTKTTTSPSLIPISSLPSKPPSSSSSSSTPTPVPGEHAVIHHGTRTVILEGEAVGAKVLEALNQVLLHHGLSLPGAKPEKPATARITPEGDEQESYLLSGDAIADAWRGAIDHKVDG